jgi:hypothetical protein
MRVQQFQDDGIEQIATANLDAFFADLKADPQQGQFSKAQAHDREMEAANHALDVFEEEMQLAACGRSVTRSSSPRRERQEPEAGEWRPGMDVDFGLEKNAGERKKSTLRAWFRSQLALGKTAADLIEHAAAHDRATADVLRALAAE